MLANLGANRSVLPRADVYETPDEITLLIDLPGISLEQVEVLLDDRVLKVEAETNDIDRNSVNILLSERKVGNVFRTFKLPASVIGCIPELKCSNGVLEIKIKKKFSGPAIHIPVISTSSD